MASYTRPRPVASGHLNRKGKSTTTLMRIVPGRTVNTPHQKTDTERTFLHFFPSGSSYSGPVSSNMTTLSSEIVEARRILRRSGAGGVGSLSGILVLRVADVADEFEPASES
jgi:hypothetical protein